MKYSILKDIKLVQDKDFIKLSNIKLKNNIELSGLSAKLFDLITKQNELAAIKYLKANYNYTDYECRFTLNSLLYPLLYGKFIASKSQKTVNKKTVYIKSCILEITDTCNFKCSHCYVNKTCSQLVKFNDLKEFADELYELNCNMILLTGGEILTHPQFFDIYEYLYNKGFLISLNTNGSLINDKIIDFLVTYPPFAVEISLYGDNETNFDNFTKTNNLFNKTIENITSLRDKGINVILKNVLNKNNQEFFYKLRELAHKLNLKFRSDYFVFPKTNEIGKMNDTLVSPIDALAYLKKQNNAEEHYLTKFNQQNGSKYVFKCKHLDDSIFVDSKLNISMCICMQHEKIPYSKGNLFDAVIKLRRFKEIIFSPKAKCKKCKLKPLCRYCPGKFYMITQNYEKPHEWFCELGQLVYKNFIQGYKFIRKQNLSIQEQNELFKIIKTNMTNLGFVVGDKDREMWTSNLLSFLTNKNYYLYIIYKDGSIVGFYSIIVEDNKPTLCELQLDKTVQKTRLIFEVIKSIFNQTEFKNFDTLYFGINKSNKQSINTFTHLGAECISENEKAYRYKINRDKVEKYLSRLNSHIKK